MGVRVCRRRYGGNMPTFELKLRPEQSERELIQLCARKLHAPCKYFKIKKKSLDARDKNNIVWVYTVECASKEQVLPPRVFERITKPAPPVYVVGAGPAGLFCAVRLIRHGIKPIVLERGKRVEERKEDIEKYFRSGILDTQSNVQFGEGGAGTFSDGKLNTQTNSPLHREILDTFVEFGAPEEISYLGKPHIGSDKLQTVVAAMREYILANGGEMRYNSRLTDLVFRGGALSAIEVNGVREEAQLLVLAVGHSARDTFEMLLSRGFRIEQKEFAVGVRIEHLQSAVGKAQYGEGYLALPPADYKLVSHASERAVYTFCMCPGGVVIPSASEEGGVVTNGMSNYLRDGKNANSALVAQVRASDFSGDAPLAGMEFQRKIERAAYSAAGGGRAPVQLVGDFLSGKESYYFGEVQPTFARGTAFAPLESYLPPQICGAIRTALPDMNRRLSGFSAYEALLTGVESRTSSPVRVLRGDDLQAAGFTGVYPCGEGCGYAGGISSAAADGLRVAAAIAKKFL